jgi:ssDNA thymidine ADP-ribosyltransferase, DarT
VSPIEVVEAVPRSAAEISLLPERPLVVAAAVERGVTEVIHYTTMNNLIGILATSLECSSRVQDNPTVEKVHEQNCPDRSRDAAWLDYVNLSISRINHWIFGSSRGRWHPDAVWVVLAFDVEILGHPGVVFTTTNNAYPSCLRAEGLPGFERMFADPVLGYNSRRYARLDLPDHHTSDHCAEVLYPGAVDISFLNTIYTRTDDEDTDDLFGIMKALNHQIDVVVNPKMFRG